MTPTRLVSPRHGVHLVPPLLGNPPDCLGMFLNRERTDSHRHQSFSPRQACHASNRSHKKALQNISCTSSSDLGETSYLARPVAMYLDPNILRPILQRQAPVSAATLPR